MLKPAQSVFQAWKRDFEDDPIARLTESRWGFLRAVGNARRSVLANKLMTAMPYRSEVVFWTTFTLMLTAYFALVGVTLHDGGRHNVTLMSILLAVFGLCWVLVFGNCFWHRRKIYETDPHLFMPFGQVVRRGNLLQTGSRASTPQQNHIDVGSNVHIFNVSSSNVMLGDFELRHRAYQIRSGLHALSLVLNSVAHIIVHIVSGAAIVKLSLLVTAQVILAALTLEALLSFLVGQQKTLSFVLGKCSLSLKSTSHNFEPFDPRAAVVQNFGFAVFLLPGSFASFYILLREGMDSTCPALWMIPAVTSLLLLVVTQVGVPYSFCPGTFIVGLLVAAGQLPKPQQAAEKTLLLTYGMFGPVVELSNVEPRNSLDSAATAAATAVCSVESRSASVS